MPEYTVKVKLEGDLIVLAADEEAACEAAEEEAAAMVITVESAHITRNLTHEAEVIF